MSAKYTLDTVCVGHGNGFNDHMVIIRDATGKKFLEVGEYVTEVFAGGPSKVDWPSFMAPEPPPYSEKTRMILRALNAYKESTP